MKPVNQIKIVIVGDYSIFRIALRMLLESEENLKVVAEVSDGDEIINLSNSQIPDLILVDLPEEDETSEFLESLTPFIDKTPVLVLAGSSNGSIYQKCLRMGINGLVLKEKSAEVLFKAIERVHRGEFWFDRVSMRETIRELVNEKQMLFEAPQIAAHNVLTEREKQVVDLVCKGLKNKEIAGKLFITETTIRHHLSSIFEKLNLTSRLELVIYSFQNKIVELPKVIEENGRKIKSASRY